MIKKLLLALTLLVISTGSVIYGLNLWINHWVNQPINTLMAQELVVKSGDTAPGISLKLQKNGSISTLLPYKLAFVLLPEMTQLKVGHYQLTEQMTPKSLFLTLASGKEKQFSITFIEGSHFGQWLASLQGHPQVDYQPRRINDYIASFPAIDVSGTDYPYARVEGKFFPDTYHFTAKTPAIDILKRAHQALQHKLTYWWQRADRQLPLTNKSQLLIMASLIEKETGLGSERATIASVFINRLRRGMRLQTDPTVIYGMGNAYHGDITYQHLRNKNPYNTYVIKGLPPTPIAMPSEAAIAAVIKPASTEFLYFVASGDGGHVFSRTLKAHQQATKQYLKKLHKNNRE